MKLNIRFHHRTLHFWLVGCLVLFGTNVFGFTAQAQDADSYVQQQITFQKQRLGSGDVEERRDAVLRLGWLRRAEASRAAAPALNDPSENVRAAACGAAVFMPGDEAAGYLRPVLQDKRPFVRQEAAYALGQTGSRTATGDLITVMQTDRYLSVRGAAAIALGQIADPSAVDALAAALKGVAIGKISDKSKTEFEFLRRSAAVSLGQIGDRAGVPELIAALGRSTEPDDVRREAARSLGLIADPSSAAALRAALTDRDPYLSQLAQSALERIAAARN